MSNAHAASSACGEVVKALAKGRRLDAAFVEDASCEQHKVWIFYLPLRSFPCESS